MGGYVEDWHRKGQVGFGVGVGMGGWDLSCKVDIGVGGSMGFGVGGWHSNGWMGFGVGGWCRDGRDGICGRGLA